MTDRLRSVLVPPLVFAWLSLVVGACSAGSTTSKTNDRNPTLSPGAGSGSIQQPSLGTGGNVPALGPITEPEPEKCETVLELTLRDFDPATHPDFEAFQGLNDIGCGMVAETLGSDLKPVFVSGIGTKKRVVTGDWDNLAFASCDEWNGWNPEPVITGQATFDQWYRDVPNVNQSVKMSVTLTDSGTGQFVFESAAFFPLDNMGFGNTPNKEHNFHFTTEGHVKFGYVAGQKFTFRGDDDLWIFVNGKLALDLGGMHMPIAATLDFDAQAATLGISPGGTYQMDIFHAERHTDESNFRIETNIRCFEPVVVK